MIKRRYSVYKVWEHTIDAQGFDHWHELSKPRYITWVEAYGPLESMDKVSKRTDIPTSCLFPKVCTEVHTAHTYPRKRKKTS